MFGTSHVFGTDTLLRTEAGRDPYEKALTDMVGELATRSDAFRTQRAAHNVRLHHTGRKQFHHPDVGRLDLAFEAMPFPADPGPTLTADSADPGTPASDGLRPLDSWAVTTAEHVNDPDQVRRSWSVPTPAYSPRPA